MLTNDLAAIFADTSLTVSVQYGAQSTRGFFSSEDMLEQDGQGGQVVVSRRVVTIGESALTGLQHEAEITVDGTTYRIHDTRAAGRGKLKVILA